MTKSSPILVGVHQAKTRLSELLRLVDAGQEVEITRGGVPVARIVSARPSGKRTLGTDEGLLDVPEDFDAPLPDDVLNTFLS